RLKTKEKTSVSSSTARINFGPCEAASVAHRSSLLPASRPPVHRACGLAAPPARERTLRAFWAAKRQNRRARRQSARACRQEGRPACPAQQRRSACARDRTSAAPPPEDYTPLSTLFPISSSVSPVAPAARSARWTMQAHSGHP